MDRQQSGYITNIQSYAIHDGPGIRTTIFLKGCPLRCVWCHNPESWNQEPEMMENGEMSGVFYTAGAVIEKMMKDKMFFDNSGGGVTISGGEPLMVYSFTKALIDLCRENQIHTVVETSGYASEQVVHQTLKDADLIFYDLKVMDEEKHRQYTGVSNRLILENLKYLYHQLNKEIVIRMPVIPGYNDDVENIDQMISYISTELGKDIPVHLLPYHRLGEAKRLLIHLQQTLDISVPDPKAMEWIRNRMRQNLSNVQIGGSM